MTFRRYKIGDVVSWIDDETDTNVSGTVSCFRDHEDRQMLWITVSKDETRTILVCLQTGVDGVSTILPPPATVDEAMRLADALLSGTELRMPVNQQLRTLAAGVLTLGAAEDKRRSGL